MAAAGYATAGPGHGGTRTYCCAKRSDTKRRVETQRRRGAAKAAWKDSALPGWLDEGVYCVEILPRLKQVSLSETVKDAKYRELAMCRNHRAYLDQRETKLPRRMVH
jgi:hypothetical protein